LKGNEIWVSIAACDGKRVKYPIKVGQRYLPILKAQKPTFATLKRHRDEELYLHITVSVPDPEPSDPPQNIVGVDLGEIDLLVASNGIKVAGVELIERRKRFRVRRSALQRKGTRAKRARKRLGDKERRWARTYLHTVSRRFVDSLLPNSLVVLEDLKDIRNRCKRNSAEQRAQFHTWAFRQLQFMIAYKARLAGHQVIFVKPNHTSQTCPRCGHVSPSNRLSTRLFRCQRCKFQHNANFVAAVNLANRAAQAGLGGAGLLSTSLRLRASDPFSASCRLSPTVVDPAYVDPAQMETLRQIRYSLKRIAAEAAERGDFRWSLRLSTLDSLLRMSEDFDKDHRYDLAILAMVVALVYAWILSEEALTENAINLQARNTDGR
jgi:IS605 OrfB family transposase